MTTYRAPLNDFRFVIEELVPALTGTSSPDAWPTAHLVLESAARICVSVLEPLNRSGDESGCRFEAGSVSTPHGFSAAFAVVRSCGWLSSSEESADAVMTTPTAFCFDEMLAAANVAFSNYLGPTKRVAQALRNLADPQLTATYLEGLLNGSCGGTLCLTEPHCGTDLGLISTRAKATGTAGEYALTGTKIFVTSGEHDLTENIVHLVLARIAGAPTGVKGLSLFLVPKLYPATAGDAPVPNAIVCAGIEHKMGIRASATCMLRFEGARGVLLGAAGDGLRGIFSIMERERLTIATQSVGLAEHAFQKARSYARERLQGRAAGVAGNTQLPADPIIVHPDVRRMLLTMKAYTEGARALLLWTAHFMDVSRSCPQEVSRAEARDLVQLLTPMVKAFVTDISTETANLGMQVMGGHGYIRESGMEQLVRDVRVTQLYAGANGIQALDLLARKLPARDGRTLELFIRSLEQSVTTQTESTMLAPLRHAVSDGIQKLRMATSHLQQQMPSDANLAGSASYAYLQLFGFVALGFLWLHAARIAHQRLQQQDATHTRDFWDAKIVTAHFYMQHLLPNIERCVSSIRAGSDVTMRLRAEAF
jgi:alkylation response protein AidB-like acyl-CoA dehydrogenase